MGKFINTFQSMDVARTLLNMISKNQTIITSNVSNYHTPGYVKKNSNFQEVLGSMRSPVLTDLAKKMGPAPMVTEPEGKVVLEEELLNMQRNFLYYSMVSRRSTSLITAIKAIAQVGR
jgi:flagellar basal body rod protein FlgB